MAFILLAQNYQNKTLLDDYPRPFSIHFFLASFPLQKIQVLSQPPLQLPMAIGSILGQLDGRDKWLWNLGQDFLTSVQDKKEVHPAFFLPVWVTSENVMPGALAVFCDKAENAQVTGDIFEPLYQLEWPVCTFHEMRLIISYTSVIGHSITLNQRHALSFNNSKIWIIYPVAILCSPFPDYIQISIWYPVSLCIPCSQWKQIPPSFQETTTGWFTS